LGFERNSEAMNPAPLPGCVWLDAPEKVLHVTAAQRSSGMSGRLMARS
jgi:hypothetical protein